MEESKNNYSKKNKSDLLKWNSDAIYLLEIELNKNKSDMKLVHLCNRTIDIVLSAFDVNFKITK